MISDDTDVPVKPEIAVDDTVPLENDTTEEAAKVTPEYLPFE